MDELSTYLNDDYRRDETERARLRRLAQQVVDSLTQFAEDGTWPYELDDGKPVATPPGDFSFSTNAMILHSLAAAAGPLRRSVLVPGAEGWLVDPPLLKRTSADKAKKANTQLKAFRSGLNTLGKHCLNGKTLSESKTFGTDDPLTLARLLEIDRFTLESAARNHESVIQGFPPRLRKKLDNRANSKIKEAVHERDSIFETPDHTESQVVDHAFPVLSLVQMADALQHWQKAKRKRKADAGANGTESNVQRQQWAQPFFESRLHRHLSSSLLPDSGFDAAELVFSLEGLLLCSRLPPHQEVVRKVFEILRERQAKSPYWRPSRPFRSSPQGMVLLPVSVEIANSLLRVCCALDHDKGPSSYFSDNLDLFKRYAYWVLSRVTFGEVEGGEAFCGWKSEHVAKEGRVHLWDTSQVLLFLIQYSGMLRRHIARTGLEASRLQYKRPRRSENNDGKPAETGYSGSWGEENEVLDSWAKVVRKMEPLKGVERDSPYQIYHRVTTSYVAPHTAPPGSEKRLYSILLYGPPGTGKSAFATELANTLRYRLVTVTPSDFLAAGPADVERRAKDLFEFLKWQSETVILFDEIDHFLLDRESNLYRRQTGIFQFLTPGMLTKIKELHDAKRPIFIIATNYWERIDNAIKRLGRIDDQLPLLPPDSIARKEILEGLLQKEHSSAGHDAIRKIVAKTRLLVFGELVQMARIADGLLERNNADLEQVFLEARERVQPTITLGSYKGRFRLDEGDSDKFPTVQEPFEEFYLLVYLACENRLEKMETSYDALTEDERQLVVKVAQRELKEDFESFAMAEKPPLAEQTTLARSIKDQQLRRDVLKVVWLAAQDNLHGA